MKKGFYSQIGIPEPLSIAFCIACAMFAAMTVIPGMELFDTNVGELPDAMKNYTWLIWLIFILSIAGFFPVFPDETKGGEDQTKLHEKLKIGSITTHGEYSPGFVHGNLVANGNVQITQTIVKQYLQKKNKPWRKIYASFATAIPSLNGSLENLFIQFIDAQIAVSTEYDRYTFLVFFEDPEEESNPTTKVNIVSPRGKVLKQWTDTRNTQIEAATDLKRLPIPKKIGAKYLDRRLKKILGLSEGWDASINFTGGDLRSFTRPVHVEIDPSIKHISLSMDEDVPSDLDSSRLDSLLDIGSYEQRLQTTSEMLKFVSALRHPIAAYNLPENLPEWVDDYSLTKLYAASVKDAFKWENIRINADDPEDWDYVNLDYDREMSGVVAQNNEH